MGFINDVTAAFRQAPTNADRGHTVREVEGASGSRATRSRPPSNCPGDPASLIHRHTVHLPVPASRRQRTDSRLGRLRATCGQSRTTMRLKSFEIRGYAVLSDMTVDVRDRLVIIGANDVGKTWILRLLHLLLGASVQQLYQALSVTDIREGAEVLAVSARLEEFDEDEASQYPFAMTVEEGQADYLVIRLEVRPSDDDPENVVIERFFPDAGNRCAPNRSQLLAFGWRFLPAHRAEPSSWRGAPVHFGRCWTPPKLAMILPVSGNSFMRSTRTARAAVSSTRRAIVAGRSDCGAWPAIRSGLKRDPGMSGR